MTAMLTPYDKGSAKPAGRNLFRKQLLPIAKIDYKGRPIDFTRDYLAGLVKAFNDRAYDQVPFQLADAANTHTDDPERFRGEIAALELTDDGLDVIVAATEDGARVLRENPRLGVSAKIVEDYARADRKFFPRAVKHVLGTLDPRLTGMRPWEAVEASNDDGEVIDLTAMEYAAPGAPERPAEPQQQRLPADPAPDTEEHIMALTDTQEARLAKLLDLPDEQFDALLTAPAEQEETEGEGTEGEAELTDEQLQDLLDTLGETEDATEGEPEGEKVTAGAGAQLSAEAQAAIDLANSRAEETELQLARVTTQLARTAYEAERDTWARTLGIPPRITDLARPLLEGEGRTVDLANGKSADAGAIVRKLITEFGKTMKALDLSVELGSDEGADATARAEEQAVAERKELVGAVRSMTGI